MKSKKITLIEVAVVMSIIAILLSLLLPTLAKARETARIAACANKQKQIGLAFALYHDDNERRYPIYGTSTDEQVSWDDQLGDYDGREITQEEKEYLNFRTSDPRYDNDLYLCPSNIQKRDIGVLKSYTINDEHLKTDMTHDKAVRGVAGWAGSADDKFGWSIKYTKITRPSNFIVLTEAQSYANLLGFAGGMSVGGGGDFSSSYSPVNLPVRSQDIGGVKGFYIHNSQNYKLNTLHGDGHVSLKKIPDSLGEYSANFYEGTWTSSGELIDTDWNALR
jgi:type II secretory pathway pseudopilin PulG